MSSQSDPHLFGTRAGMYTDFRNDEDGLQYLGVRRHAAFEAVDITVDHWIVAPATAVEAAIAARRDFGIEGYETRWRVDAGAGGSVSEPQISFRDPQHDNWQLVARDEHGNFLLPRSEFPDAAGEVMQGIVDRVVGTAADAGLEVNESWTPERVDGWRAQRKGSAGVRVPDHGEGVAR